jgi:hypothetical protein
VSAESLVEIVGPPGEQWLKGAEIRILAVTSVEIDLVSRFFRWLRNRARVWGVMR